MSNCNSCKGTVKVGENIISVYPSHLDFIDVPPEATAPTHFSGTSGGEVLGFGVPQEDTPTIEEIHLQGYEEAYVPVEDDCILQKQNEPAPCVTEDCEDCDKPPMEARCLNPNAEETVPTAGSTLECKWLDALPVRRMKLFGRVGKRLATFFKGAKGYLYLNDDGHVSVTENVSLKISRLMHKFFFLSGQPIVGPPVPAKYIAVGDANGNVYGHKGLANKDSIEVWNHQDEQWEVTELDKLLHKGQYLQSDTDIEITGQTTDLVPVPKSLRGQGIVYLAPSSKIVEDDCGNQSTVETWIAKTLPYPVLTNCDDCVPILGFVNGEMQWVNPADFSCLKGETGSTGATGATGASGPAGANGAHGVQTFGTCCDTTCP